MSAIKIKANLCKIWDPLLEKSSTMNQQILFSLPYVVGGRVSRILTQTVSKNIVPLPSYSNFSERIVIVHQSDFLMIHVVQSFKA